MSKFFIILALAFVGCNADSPVNCGRIPDNIFECMDIAPVFTDKAVEKCRGTKTPCAKLNCLFTETGLMSDGKVDKQKARQFYDNYASQYPVWGTAVNHLKAACLGDKELPPQGAELHCPVMDILHCALNSFVKNVPDNQWKQTEACASTKAFAKACPVCPPECFAAQIPTGSCNACLGLPRSA